MPAAKIMIVEDEVITAQDIKMTLEKMGYIVTSMVTSGEDAIKMAEEDAPDLILMDIVLNGQMDGIKAAEQIHSCFDIPVIYLTAHWDDKILQRAKTTETYGYLLKPFNEKELYINIEMALFNAQIEKKLNESEKRFRAIAESSPDAIVSADRHGKITYWNESAKRIFGYDKEEVLGKPARILLAEQYRDADIKAMKKFAERGFSPIIGKTIEVYCLKKDGTEFPVETSYSTWKMGGETFYSVIIRDISERKRMEEDILKTSKLESIGILAGGIAHDYNNILSAILGNISLAKTYLKPDDEVFRLLSESEKASMHAKDLTHKLITFSKGGAPVKTVVPISGILKDITEFALSGSNVRCEFSMPGDLWPVDIDEAQISQAIHNLVINASDAMPEGGTVKVGAENVNLHTKNALPLKEGNYVKISVNDQGVGIPAKHLKKVFDPYFSTKVRGNQKGMGLGLSICHSIINKHDGHITVKSKVGVRTTFFIYLPAFKKEAIMKDPAKEETVAGKGRILVMDDEEMIRDMIDQVLRRLGYQVHLSKDGAEAIEHYKEAMESGKPFDAVILDLTVRGGMGGEKAIQKLLEIDPGVKGIISSGYSNDPVMNDFRKYGFTGVVPKPYRIDDLDKTLNQVIMGTNEPD